MKKVLERNMVDCADCDFGGCGDNSCGLGGHIMRHGQQGCVRGRAARKRPTTPLQEYKQVMMAGLQPGAAGRRA